MHYQLLDLLLRRVPFQIIPIQLSLPQVNFTRSVVTSTSNINAPTVPDKGMSTYAMESFKFFILNKFAKMLNFFFFLLYHYSVWSVD